MLRAPSSLSVTTTTDAITIASPKNSVLVEDSPSSSTTTPGLKSVVPQQQQQQTLTLTTAGDEEKQTKKKKTVRFNRTIFNRRIPHLNDLSLKLRHEIWIQPEEYQAIRNRCVVTVKMMMRGDLPLVDDDCEGAYYDERPHQKQKQRQHQQQHCVRGLEGKTRDGSIRRKQYKHDSITAVLDEQQYYWENITNSSSSSSSDGDHQQQEPDVAIMEAYKAYTSSCAQQARELAERDEEFVRRCVVRQCEDEHDGDESQHEYHSCDEECTSSDDDDDDDDDISVPCVEEIIEKLSNVVSLKGQRAALLFEIERNSFYENPSIGPRISSYVGGDDDGDDDDENCGDGYNQGQGEESVEATDSVPIPISSIPSSPPTSVSSFVSMALSISSSSSSRLSSSPPSLVWDEDEEEDEYSSGTLSCTPRMEEDVGSNKDSSSSSPLSATSFPGNNKIQKGRQSMLMDIRKRLTFTSNPNIMSTSNPATTSTPAKKIFWGRKKSTAPTSSSSKIVVRGGGQGLSASHCIYE